MRDVDAIASISLPGASTLETRCRHPGDYGESYRDHPQRMEKYRDADEEVKVGLISVTRGLWLPVSDVVTLSSRSKERLGLETNRPSTCRDLHYTGTPLNHVVGMDRG